MQKTNTLLLITCIAIISISSIIYLTHCNTTNELKNLLREKLVSTDQVPKDKDFDCIYILGGNEQSLLPKFQKASEFFHQGKQELILVYSRPGITEYDHKLKRNLTNDEWSSRQLQQLLIPKKKIGFVTTKESYFGTFSEARAVSKLTKKYNYSKLLLVTSSYHTKRVRKSFQHFLKDTGIKVNVIGSRMKHDLKQLIIEFIKLKVYQAVLL